jgi:type IV secretory pathway VirJ component
MKLPVLSACLLLALAGQALAQSKEDTISYGAFGDVQIYRESDKPSSIVLFVSGDGGWNRGVVDMAQSLAGLDALVAGIDITHYLNQTAGGDNSCTYSAGDLQGLGQYLQTKFGYDRYTPPVLVGYSSGATLVYGALVQAPPTTFTGAISMGFCPDILSPKPLCKGSGLTHSEDPKHKGIYVYGKVQATSAPWVALQGEADEVCTPAAAKGFVDGIGNASIVTLPKVGHGFAVEKNWMPQFKEAFRSLVSQRETVDAAIPKPEPLDDLPLIENGLPAPNGKPLAIILTGDGGWASIDRDIGGVLNKKGINVVGLNTLQYFWSEKTPDQSARDLARILAWYENAWAPSRILLIGYSLGADVLPFMINRLPQKEQDRIGTVALLGAGHDASFTVHVSDWLGAGKHDDALPIKPEASKLTAANRLCFYGEDETADSVCPTLDPSHFAIVKTKGGHHFDGDYTALADRIMEAAIR